MFSRSWIRDLLACARRADRQAPARCRPAVEVLEGRVVPATFAPASPYAAGDSPRSVAVGDFNGDGKQDLAVANVSSDNVSVLLGDGNGTFAGAVHYAAGNGPISVAVGDFNGDGKLDLATANHRSTNINTHSGNVSVLVGNGDGSFAGAVNYAVGAQPISVAVGDFNGDTRQDLAVVNQFSDNVSVLLGSATVPGTFQSAAHFGAGDGADSVAVGDFNGDGKLDLAVANQGSDNVSVLLGDGTGSFEDAVNYAAGDQPSSVSVGDFNRDGKHDLAVANFNSDNVSVLLGSATVPGTFQSAAHFGAGDRPSSVAVGDFNGDGKQDLAVANQFSGDVGVLLGNGDGSFQPAAHHSAGGFPHWVAVGDFDGDGKQDLATANANSDTVSVLLNITNTAPTGIALSNTSVAENQRPSTVVGVFSTTDPDAGDTFTYTLVGGDADADNASFSIDDSGILKTLHSFDFEPKPSYSIRVQSTDAGGLTFEKAFTISVTDVNETPAADAGGPYAVAEGGAVTLSGTGTDPDHADTLSYAWDLDGDGTFETTGPHPTFSAAGLDGPAERRVGLRVTDARGLSADSTATIQITDVAPQLSLHGRSRSDPGRPYLLRLRSVDPGQDPIRSWTIRWGDGTVQTVRGDRLQVLHHYPLRTQRYVIRATATDDDGVKYQAQPRVVRLAFSDPRAALVADSYFALTGAAIDAPQLSLWTGIVHQATDPALWPAAPPPVVVGTEGPAEYATRLVRALYGQQWQRQPTPGELSWALSLWARFPLASRAVARLVGPAFGR